MGSERIVGIDLGTSNTVVAYVDELDQVRLAPDHEGQMVHPSVVSFHPGGGVVVGVAGKQRKVIDPKNTIYSAKRMIGQPFSAFPVQETARRVPFEIKQGSNEQAIVTTRAGEFAVPEISAIVLDHAKKLASTALREEVARAVVTVPASFNDVQRSSTATAGALAGLTVVRVLNEPTAAAIAYGNTKRLDEIIAVYDWGGGTFDITILKLEDQVYTVLGTSGDAFLGGEDMDERLVDKMVAGFLQQHRIDLRTHESAMIRLRAVAEHTKIELSRRSRAVVKIEEIAHGKNGAPINLEATLTRDDFLGAIDDLVDRTFASCKEAMVLAGISHDKIRDVVLVGGTTRIPFVRDRVAKFFQREPRADMNPEDAIATGAALQAASIEKMLSRTPKRPAVESVPIPLDDLEEQTSADPGTPIAVEPERSPSKIAEHKRPKSGTDMFSGQPKPKRVPDDPTKTAERAKAFFGDLFGDKPKEDEPAPAKPAPKMVATRPLARIKAPAKPSTQPLPPIVETRRDLPPKNRTMALPTLTRPPAAPDAPTVPPVAPRASTEPPGASTRPPVPSLKLPPQPPGASPKPPKLPSVTRPEPPPVPTMPTVDLAPMEADDFAESEKSGELFINIDPATVPPRSKPRDSDSQFAIEIDPPSMPPGPPIDQRTKPRDSTSQFAIEIDPPSVPPGSGISIEIDPPSAGSQIAIEIGIDPPTMQPGAFADDPRRRTAGLPVAFELDPPDPRRRAAPESQIPFEIDPPSLPPGAPIDLRRQAAGSPVAFELDPPANDPRRRAAPESQVPFEIDPPSLPPGAPIDPRRRTAPDSQIAIEIDPPTMDPRRQTSGSPVAFELDPPETPIEASGLDPHRRPAPTDPAAIELIDPDAQRPGDPMDLVMPPSRPTAPAQPRFPTPAQPRAAQPPRPARQTGGVPLDFDPATRALDQRAPATPPRPPAQALAVELDFDEPAARAPVSVDLDFNDAGPARAAPPPQPRSLADLDFDEAPPPRAASQPVPIAPRPMPTVVDVTPRGLGIATVAGFCEELIRRNSQLPGSARKLFATARDLQDSVRIIVCQGESRRMENNTVIGELILENLPKRRRGETQIDVEFRLDASGILHVSARDVATGTEQRARLDLRGGMAPEALSAAADRIQQLSRRS